MEPDVLDGPDTTDRAGARVVSVIVNGERRGGLAPVRMTLADFVRHELGLTGTHLGCEHGVCGACTIILDGATIETVEGLAEGDELSPLQQAFHRNHALQCGFCTGGFLMSITAALRDGPVTADDEAREVLSGNICRCTGYAGMVRAVRETSDEIYGADRNGERG
jgi:aerobic-type carbon monoxide dehydrogenase small subunit (CoxS/CutS family)